MTDDWVADDDWKPDNERTWLDTAKSVGQTADDVVRAAANAVSFGMADRLAGYMGGQGTDVEVKKSEAARERSPYGSIGGDVAGAVMLPGIGGRQLAARYGGGLGARALGYGAEGAALGAAQGAGTTYTGNLPDYLRNATIGGALGGAFGSAGGAAFGPRPNVSRAETPTTAELYSAANRDYGLLRGNQAVYESPHLATRADQLENRLLTEGYVRDDSPGTWRAIDRMRLAAEQPGGINTPGDVEAIRSGLNRIPRGEARATDRDSARVVKDELHDFLENPPLGAVRPGTERAAVQAGETAQRARDTWAGARRSNLIDNIISNAEDAAAAANSGLNRENVIRQAVKNLQKEPPPGQRSKLAGFSDEERAALNSVVHRGRIANTLRTVGNAMGGGGGVATPLLAMTGAGSAGAAAHYFGGDPATAGVVAGAIPLVGMGLRGASNRSARNAIDYANTLIHQRNPLYNYRASMAGMQPGPSPLSGPNTARLRDAITLQMLKQNGITIRPRGPDASDDWQ